MKSFITDRTLTVRTYLSTQTLCRISYCTLYQMLDSFEPSKSAGWDKNFPFGNALSFLLQLCVFIMKHYLEFSLYLQYSSVQSKKLKPVSTHHIWQVWLSKGKLRTSMAQELWNTLCGYHVTVPSCITTAITFLCDSSVFAL